MPELYVLGTGPGAPEYLLPAARAALQRVEAVVGYGLYLDLLGELVQGKARHALSLGQEAERARLALRLAAAGTPTALVSSGDPGIYAMATLVMELMDREGQGAGVEVEVIPGISAAQLAAARLGAPLGHDFCFVSLSDLLTPWPVIERRLRAAAEGDFVTCLYNPVSPPPPRPAPARDPRGPGARRRPSRGDPRPHHPARPPPRPGGHAHRGHRRQPPDAPLPGPPVHAPRLSVFLRRHLD